MVQRVFVDSNIFYSKTLMDWLILLRNHNPGMFQVHTTEDVFAEVLYSMRRKQPQAPGEQIARRANLMRESVDEILQGYRSDIPFSGKDPNDYHVHAAATTSCAHIVLTCNSATDITQDSENECYDVMHPDIFFGLVADSSPRCLVPIAREQLQYWGAKEKARQLDESLKRAGCPVFADKVREALREIARMP